MITNTGCKPTADGIAWDDEVAGAAPVTPIIGTNEMKS